MPRPHAGIDYLQHYVIMFKTPSGNWEPAIFALMTSKSEVFNFKIEIKQIILQEAYSALAQLLLQECGKLGVQVVPKRMLFDFEAAPRKAFSIFPGSTMATFNFIF